MSLRVSIYTIALNEEQFATRWIETTNDADHRLVADTGSSDATVAILQQGGVSVVPIAIRPWRFDDARNAALALLPTDIDIAVSLDMDETLVPGWRNALENSWKDCTRLHYGYVWSWTPSGHPDVVFHSDKIAGRHTHRWQHPIHEVLKPTVPERVNTYAPVLIEHHPDSKKPRSQYLKLLELAVAEDPTDDRSAHYLAREYVFHRLYDKAITEFLRHLSLPKAVWDAERAASMRYLGKCYEALDDRQAAQQWFLRATLEAPTKEALIDAAAFQLRANRFHAVIDLCESALEAPKAVGSYLTDRYATQEGPYDLASVAYYHIGQRAKAIELARIAIDLNPWDERLKSNLRMMESV